MKLFIKRELSASSCEFVVSDASGNEKYKVNRKQTKVTPNTVYRISDVNGEGVAAAIRRLPVVGTKTFVLKAYKTHVTFVMVPTQKGIYAYFYGNNWHIRGDIAAKNFEVIDVDNTEIFSHKCHSDYGELTVVDEENELFCVAAAVCVNLINTTEQHVLKTANI